MNMKDLVMLKQQQESIVQHEAFTAEDRMLRGYVLEWGDKIGFDTAQKRTGFLLPLAEDAIYIQALLFFHGILTWG